MNTPVWRPSLHQACCIKYQYQALLRQCRPRSTLAAIKKGVRESRDDDDGRKGRRDRLTHGPAPANDFAPRRLGRTLGRTEAVSEISRGSQVFSPTNRFDARRSTKSTKTFDRTPQWLEHTAVKRDSGSSDAPGSGVLRHIKLVCRYVRDIREREARSEDISTLTEAVTSSLSDVNQYVKEGSFRDDAAQAVASLFVKKAPQGIFITGQPRGGGQSVIYQKRDGTFELALGRADRDLPRASGPPVQQSTSQKTERESQGPNDKPSKPAFEEGPARKRFQEVKSAKRQTRQQDRDDLTISIPYTTAASEFLYGFNSVLAALRGARRKLYRLYIHPKIFERDSAAQAETDSRHRSEPQGRSAQEFVELAKAAKIPFRNEFDTRLLDRMSNGRPHNGIVLEVSRLPAPPVVSLGKPDQRKAAIPVNLATQTAEEVAVNGKPDMVKTADGTWRYPLVVLLDGILDPGNLGNIIRTCHFYGVDAIAVATTTCADLSLGVVAKASSGACEAVRLLAVKQPSNFIFESAMFRWKVYAAVAPDGLSKSQVKHDTTIEIARDSPLSKHPCILMIGSEGQGLRENLKRRADRFVSIAKGGRPDDSPDIGLDSLNVTVATGVLLESFLTKPPSAPDSLDTSSELGF